MPILIPVLLLLGVGILCAILLSLASYFFGVEDDEKANALRECLPGANCGACGFSGCDAYAKALSDGVTEKTNLCHPGGDSTARQLSELIGVEAEDVIEQVAYVACGGACLPEERKYIYSGSQTCKAANMLFAGDRHCTFACLGYGDCMKVCPRDAISITDRGIADIDPQKCIGCGLCARTCPNGIIHLVKDITRVVVKCNNHYKGQEVRKFCDRGCIACGKCEKSCPTEAIKVVDNLARIDYDKCISCGKCREVCPVHCIEEDNFICGAHFE